MSYLSYNRFISRYTIFNAHIKVDGNEKWAGFMGKKKNTVIQVLSAIVAMGGYFKFECVYFLCKNSIFPFLLVKAFWIGIVWTNRGSGVKMVLSFITAPIVLALLINFLNRRCNVNRIVILQIRSATPIQDINTSAPILLGLWQSRPIG